MNLRKLLPALLLVVPGSATAHAQANATATRTLELSAFGAVSGVYTGLGGGKNFGVVAGADLGLPPWRGMRPELEVRGLYPADHGVVDSQKSLLGGARFDFLLNHRLRPYADFLAGRGLMRYGINGYRFGNPPRIFIQTVTPVYSPGAGFDYDLSQHLSVKVDAQLQRWDGAPTQSGTIWSKVGTVGVVYRFTFGPRSLP